MKVQDTSRRSTVLGDRHSPWEEVGFEPLIPLEKMVCRPSLLENFATHAAIAIKNAISRGG